MSNVYRDRRYVVLTVLAAAVALVPVVVVVISGDFPAWLILAGPLVLLLSVAGTHLHDRAHRQRGEAPHAMFGNPLRR